MKCERARELFSEYLEGSIDYALTATVRGHIDQCSTCRHELELFGQMGDMIGSLPEVEPPSNFRHDVVMRAARMQHEHSREATGAFGLSWDYLFGRLVPARAVAIACAGAVLAALMLRVPQGMYDYVVQQMGGRPGVVGMAEQQPAGADAIEASSLYSNVKPVWQSRILGRNTLWVSVAASEVGEGRSLHEVALSINQEALFYRGRVRDVSLRIGAEVYLLPPNQFSLDGEHRPSLLWEGNVLGDAPPVVLPMILDSSQGPANLLVSYRFRDRDFAQIVLIPTGNKHMSSTNTFDFSVRPGFRPVGNNLYLTLQSLAQNYGVTIIANAKLDVKPSVVELGSDSMEDALRKALRPVGLTWGFIDKAIYVDLDFKRPEDFQ